MSALITSTAAALIALVICGFIYLRMIKREVPETIGKLQAILPIALGGICSPYIYCMEESRENYRF
nr:hypothetical protein [uncultured Butyrivibrio sp.]